MPSSIRISPATNADRLYPHAAVRHHAVAVGNQRRAEARDGVELDHVGQHFVVVVERKVHIQTFVRLGRNAAVEAAFQVDDNVDAVCLPAVQSVMSGAMKSRPASST